MSLTCNRSDLCQLLAAFKDHLRSAPKLNSPAATSAKKNSILNEKFHIMNELLSS